MQIEIVRIEDGRRLTTHAFDFGSSDAGFDDARNRLSYPVLKLEDLHELAIKLLGPALLGGFRLDQLNCHPKAVVPTLQASGEHITHS